jgi:hypothetical protein
MRSFKSFVFSFTFQSDYQCAELDGHFKFTATRSIFSYVGLRNEFKDRKNILDTGDLKL